MLTISFFFSCFFNDRIPINGVYFRIHNESNIDLKSIVLGRTINKPNGFGNTSYVTVFKNIKKGIVTSYKDTKGLHLGYDRIFIKKLPNEVLNIDRLYYKSQLNKFYQKQDSIPHPYIKDKKFQSPQFPKGKYTLKIIWDSLNQLVQVEIIKDE